MKNLLVSTALLLLFAVPLRALELTALTDDHPIASSVGATALTSGAWLAITVDPATGALVGISLATAAIYTTHNPQPALATARVSDQIVLATSFATHFPYAYAQVLRDDAVNYLASDGENASVTILAAFEQVRSEIRDSLGEEVAGKISDRNIAEQLAAL